MCNSEPLPVQAGCCSYSVCSKCTDICLVLCDQRGSGAREVYRVERGTALFCTARGSSACFTFDRMPSGTRRCPDTKRKIISASHQETNPYTRSVNRSKYSKKKKWSLDMLIVINQFIYVRPMCLIFDQTPWEPGSIPRYFS
jgi:hypothetical protein